MVELDSGARHMDVHFFLKTLIPAVQARATTRRLGDVFSELLSRRATASRHDW